MSYADDNDFYVPFNQNLKKSVHLLKDVVAVHQTLDFLCSQFNQVDLSLEVTEQGLEFLTIFLLLCIHFSTLFHTMD
jgi:hypothetical protein